MSVEIRSDSRGLRVEIGPGGAVSFGRGTPEMGVDLCVGEHPMLHRICGVISVADTGWDLANVGTHCHLTVRDQAGPGADVVVPQSRRHVEWASAVIEFPFETLVDPLLVVDRRDLPVAVDPAAAVEPSLTARTERPALARDSGYFRALVALCAPIVGPPYSPDHLPTDAEIAVRLNRTGAEDRHVTARGVQRRLDHVRQVLGLRETTPMGAAGLERRDARRQLALYTVRCGLVSVEDLEVVGDRADGGRGDSGGDGPGGDAPAAPR